MQYVALVAEAWGRYLQYIFYINKLNFISLRTLSRSLTHFRLLQFCLWIELMWKMFVRLFFFSFSRFICMCISSAAYALSLCAHLPLMLAHFVRTYVRSIYAYLAASHLSYLNINRVCVCVTSAQTRLCLTSLDIRTHAIYIHYLMDLCVCTLRTRRMCARFNPIRWRAILFSFDSMWNSYFDDVKCSN